MEQLSLQCDKEYKARNGSVARIESWNNEYIHFVGTIEGQKNCWLDDGSSLYGLRHWDLIETAANRESDVNLCQD